MKKAVIIGINDYPGYINDLRGCIADTEAWKRLLVDKYGFDSTTVITDSSATIDRVKSEVSKMINSASAGDVIVWTYSGHGTSVPGGRPDKPDGRAEAICLYDGLLFDYEIKTMLSLIKPEVHMTVVSDSCHSGTVTRMMRAELFLKDLIVTSQPRYMPPRDDEFAARVSQCPVVSRAFVPENSMSEILISGCASTETSADAHIGNGRFMGALSYFATKILSDNPRLTYIDFYARLRNFLPGQMSQQTPQLEGSDENKKRLVFT